MQAREWASFGLLLIAGGIFITAACEKREVQIVRGDETPLVQTNPVSTSFRFEKTAWSAEKLYYGGELLAYVEGLSCWASTGSYLVMVASQVRREKFVSREYKSPCSNVASNDLHLFNTHGSLFAFRGDALVMNHVASADEELWFDNVILKRHVENHLEFLVSGKRGSISIEINDSRVSCTDDKGISLDLPGM